MTNEIRDNRRTNFSSLLEYMRITTVDALKEKMTDIFESKRSNYSKKERNQEIEMFSQITLNSEDYLTELKEKKEEMIKLLEENKEYKTFKIKSCTLSAINGDRDYGEPAEVYLEIKATIVRIESDSEFERRVLLAEGYDTKFKSTEEMSKNTILKIEGRKMTLTFDNEIYVLDIKIQKMDTLNSKNTVESKLNYLQSKSKQIKFF